MIVSPINIYIHTYTYNSVNMEFDFDNTVSYRKYVYGN